MKKIRKFIDWLFWEPINPRNHYVFHVGSRYDLIVFPILVLIGTIVTFILCLLGY